MDREEKYITRIIFKKIIYEADGNKFEDIFTKIMSYKEEGFQQVKPWGNIGDRKNDGYIYGKKIYFQVYAPEKPEDKHHEAIKKAKDDFHKLLNQWDVGTYIFVFNDKYKGHHPDLRKELETIQNEHSLEKSELLVAKDLENYLYGLQDDQIFEIVGFPPNNEAISFELEFEIVREIVDHIMQYGASKKESISAPDWYEKIAHNDLGNTIAEKCLEIGAMYINEVDEFLNNNSEFTSEEIRSKLNQIYLDKKEAMFHGETLFEAIVEEMLPSGSMKYFNGIYAIMAKYFSTCDIFEDYKGKSC